MFSIRNRLKWLPGGIWPPLRSPLKELLDLEEDLDTSVASRQAACGERSADVAVWSSVELRGAYGAVAVPHLWMGPGKAMVP